MLPKSCNIGKLLSNYRRGDFLIRNNGHKINFTTAANMPPKICNVVKLLSRDFLIRINGQKVNFTTDADMVNFTTDADMDNFYGDMPPCNIVNLLSTYKRDFLIRNDGQKVKIDTLNGKFVALLHVLYPLHRNKPIPRGLLEAYKTLYPKGDFEVVFVPLTENDNDENSYEWFNKYFLNMPWLAVPFSDFETRKRVLDFLSPYIHVYSSDCMILDKLGNAVCPDSLHCFDVHGANWYPFTFERLNELDYEWQTPIKDLSLKELLSSPSRDYVLTKNRDKVLIDDLESKVVGLYFFYSQNHDADSVTLLSVYDELKAKGMDFEIVFINRYTRGGYPDEESFNKYFEKMPWLALPFGDVTSEKLAHRLSIDAYTAGTNGTALVIIKPGVFYQFYGLEVIEEYGIEAYPFTIEKAAEIEIEKLSLFSLLDVEGREFVIRNNIDKTKIKVSELKGKRICMLLFSYHVSYKTLSQLISWYNKAKSMDDEFELIYVSECKSVTEFNDMSNQMPSTWLALPFGAGRKISNMLQSWGNGRAMVAAFKPDGKYLTRNHLRVEDDWELLSNSNYPYNVDIDTVQEMRYQLIADNFWECY